MTCNKPYDSGTSGSDLEDPPGSGADNSDTNTLNFKSLKDATCSVYDWNGTSWELIESDYADRKTCQERVNQKSSPYAMAIFEYPNFEIRNGDDSFAEADCASCRRTHKDEGYFPIAGEPDSMYPENIYKNIFNRFFSAPSDVAGSGVSTTADDTEREYFENDYSLSGGSLCVRIGEHGWPGPPQVGLPETFINPLTMNDIYDGIEYGGAGAADPTPFTISGSQDPRFYNIPFYAYPESDIGSGNPKLFASYRGCKVGNYRTDTDTKESVIAKHPAWIRPVKTSNLLVQDATGSGLLPSDGGRTTTDIVNQTVKNVGRSEWFGSWIMPETYPDSSFYQNFDPGYNYDGAVGDIVQHGPQLVGWLCGFSSPAYKVAKDNYDSRLQLWKDTYHYCFDKWTCPELFKESILDETTGQIKSGYEPFDRGTECVEPLIPLNVNTNPSQNDVGAPNSGLELKANLQSFVQYVESDDNYNSDGGLAYLGMCEGGMLEYQKMVQNSLRNVTTVISESQNVKINFGTSNWQGRSRSIIPLMLQGTPFFGIQRPLTASQGQLGYMNGADPVAKPFGINPSLEDDPDYAFYAPGNFGLGGEYRWSDGNPSSRDVKFSIYDSAMNIGSNTGRNLRGIPKTGNHIRVGDRFSGGGSISTGPCSTAEYSLDAGAVGDVTKEYYTCLCTIEHLDPNDVSYDATKPLTKFDSLDITTLGSSFGRDGDINLRQKYVSNPTMPGLCDFKHGRTPRMVVKLIKNEVNTADEAPQNHFEEGNYIFLPFNNPETGLPSSYMGRPQAIYDSIVREDNINPSYTMYELIAGSDYPNIGSDGNWSTVIENDILDPLIAPSTLPEFESCCLPDGSCSSELEYARCIDQGGTPRNVSCDVPCENSQISETGSCCYKDPDTGRSTSSDNITRQTCRRLKGSFSSTKSATARVNLRESGCCESCDSLNAPSSSHNLTGGRFRSRANSSQTDIRVNNITSFDKAENDALKQELENSFKSCTLPDAYKVSAERYVNLIMNYEYEKDLACTNAKVQGMDLSLVSYFNCKCNLLDELVNNMKNTFKTNVCETNDNETDPLKTRLSVKMQEILDANRQFENNCLSIIESNTGAVSTFEKAKGCCCRYAKDGYQLGNTQYEENDLVGCSHISKFECDKFVNFNTKWTRCLSECRDGCSSPDNPAQCSRCSDTFEGEARIRPASSAPAAPTQQSSTPTSTPQTTTSTQTSQTYSSPPPSGGGY